jgi:hypothetical protein
VGAVARPAGAFDQTMAIENRMDGALGRDPEIAIEPSDLEFSDLACAPMAGGTVKSISCQCRCGH